MRVLPALSFALLVTAILPGWQARAQESAPKQDKGSYSVQLGSFATPAEAVARASEFPGARIDVSEDEAGRSRYRVLFGEFDTIAQAEAAIADSNFRDKVPDVWVNPERNRAWVPSEGAVSVARVAEGTEPAVPAAEPRSPTSFPVDVTLNCDGEESGEVAAGRSYKTRIYLDPAQSQGELDVMLRWACDPKPERSVARASFLDLAPAVGFTTTSSDAGSAFRSLYGVSLKAFQNVGGWGPEFRYRFLRSATLKEGSLSRPAYTARHEIHTGARFFFGGGWEFAPSFGFSSTELLLDAGGGGSSFDSRILPVLGLDLLKQLTRFEKGTQIWFGAGYEQRFASRSIDRVIYAGYRWHAELILRTPLSRTFGGEGFVRIESLSQDAEDLRQTDFATIFGFTLSFGRQ